MEGFNFNNAPKFKTPQEELEYLRAKIAEKEKTLSEQGHEVNKEQLAHSAIHEYRKYEPGDVMHKSALMKEKDMEDLSLRLHPETHDSKMEELLSF